MSGSRLLAAWRNERREGFADGAPLAVRGSKASSPGMLDGMLAASWVGAIAAVFLAVLAGVTAAFAGKAFRKQAQQVTLLQQQIEDQQDANARQADLIEFQAQELKESLAERLRDRVQRHRAQAERVFPATLIMSANPKSYYVEVTNASDRPVYNVTVTLNCLRGSQPASYSFEDEPRVVLMPGMMARFPPGHSAIEWDDSAMREAVWSTAWFTDAAGASWTVTSKGDIAEQNKP